MKHTIHIHPGDFVGLETNSPQAEHVGTNLEKYLIAFDQSTQEYGSHNFHVPSTLDAAGTVTFRATVYAKLAAAGVNAQLRFDHAAIGDGQAGDAAGPYTSEDSGDISLDATQDDLTTATWTETIANLGWAAGDWIACRLSRIAASGTELTGDLYLVSFSIEIPEVDLLSVTSKTGNYTAAKTDDVIEVDASSGDVTITLYAATGEIGRQIVVRRVDGSGNMVTIAGNAGADDINGETSITLNAQYEAVHLYVSDSDSWGIM